MMILLPGIGVMPTGELFQQAVCVRGNGQQSYVIRNIAAKGFDFSTIFVEKITHLVFVIQVMLCAVDAFTLVRDAKEVT